MPAPTIPDTPEGICAEGDIIVLVGVCDGGVPSTYTLGWINAAEFPRPDESVSVPESANGRKTLLERFQEQHRCTQERIEREKKKAKRRPRA